MKRLCCWSWKQKAPTSKEKKATLTFHTLFAVCIIPNRYLESCLIFIETFSQSFQRKSNNSTTSCLLIIKPNKICLMLTKLDEMWDIKVAPKIQVGYFTQCAICQSVSQMATFRRNVHVKKDTMSKNNVVRFLGSGVIAYASIIRLIRPRHSLEERAWWAVGLTPKDQVPSFFLS